MFGLGMGELTVVLVLALIFLGPKMLPEVASTLGKVIREVRKATADIKNEIQLDEHIRGPLQELRDATMLPAEELKRRDLMKAQRAEWDRQEAERKAKEEKAQAAAEQDRLARERVEAETGTAPAENAATRSAESGGGMADATAATLPPPRAPDATLISDAPPTAPPAPGFDGDRTIAVDLPLGARAESAIDPTVLPAPFPTPPAGPPPGAVPRANPNATIIGMPAPHLPLPGAQPKSSVPAPRTATPPPTPPAALASGLSKPRLPPPSGDAHAVPAPDKKT